MLRINSSRRLVSDIALSDRASSGSRHSDLHGDCDSPVYQHLFGYPDEVLVRLGIEPDRAVAQSISVRCRKCAPCLRHRSRLWAARAISETAVSGRTWFVTLTLSPERVAWVDQSAWVASTLAGSDMTDENLFAQRVRAVSPELTRWLKRVRKNSGASLRYLLVVEAHKSGVPHWHALLHEVQGTVVKRAVQSAWRYGFSHVRLVDEDSASGAWYVCKYLAKSGLARVRASQNYGDVKELITERLVGAVTLLPKVKGDPRRPGGEER